MTKQERIAAIDAAVFRTITGDDWRRALKDARSRPNRIVEHAKKILACGVGRPPKGGGGKTSTDS